ncbi:hypothetical protein [Nitratireductor luteus]|uniref:hypothetical protein n=1 Tax=Nitratireductor luteus TaxID=2976980 RepID=UPI00223FB409|nr:hypothetical protein [Nitratireductor luteus]
MNTANLQLEGVLMAMAALCRLMREQGLATADQIDGVMGEAERALKDDKLRPAAVSAANVEAALFPLRFLREANRRADEVEHAAFSGIATAVGQARRQSVEADGGQ